MTAHKQRSFLTMLGLIIGIGSVILVMSIGAGAQSLITGQIEQQGTDMIGILPGSSEEDGPPASAFGVVITTLTYDDAKALELKNNAPHVKDVAAYTTGNGILQWKNKEQSTNFTGTTASYQEVERVTVAKGRFFSKDEVESAENVMILGSAIAEDIFGNQTPVGESVKLAKKHFRVIGVLKPKDSTFFENPNQAVLIPLKTAQQSILGIKHVSFIRLRVNEEINIPQTVSDIKQTLTERHDEEDFSVRNTADALVILTTVTNAIKFFLVAIASISLFVGGVGIMNIMLITVKEKTKEIGLRKSVGATNKDILLQFLFETVIISLLGGIIGILGGTIISYAISLAVNALGYKYSFIISPIAIILSVAVSGIIGITFGTFPAKRAAKLNPIESLRYE